VLSLGRCNGKTTLAARLGLCHLAGPEAENRGEVYSAANDAARIFNEMAAIIERVPWLDDRVTVKRFTKELEDVGRASMLRCRARAERKWAWPRVWSYTTSSDRPKAATCSMLWTRR
jgi:hypothetical protein